MFQPICARERLGSPRGLLTKRVPAAQSCPSNTITTMFPRLDKIFCLFTFLLIAIFLFPFSQESVQTQIAPEPVSLQSNKMSNEQTGVSPPCYRPFRSSTDSYLQFYCCQARWRPGTARFTPIVAPDSDSACSEASSATSSADSRREGKHKAVCQNEAVEPILRGGEDTSWSPSR